MRIEKLIENTKGITDPRRSYGNLRHKLTDILVIGLCTIMCKGEDFTDMEDFGNEREQWLKTFLELPNGIPDSDTFRRVFERINPAELSSALYDWLGAEREKRGVVAIPLMEKRFAEAATRNIRLIMGCQRSRRRIKSRWAK
jgi:hypothetical protein